MFCENAQGDSKTQGDRGESTTAPRNVKPAVRSQVAVNKRQQVAKLRDERLALKRLEREEQQRLEELEKERERQRLEVEELHRFEFYLTQVVFVSRPRLRPRPRL